MIMIFTIHAQAWTSAVVYIRVACRCCMAPSLHLQYMMTMSLGSQQQQASLVLDTGSGSLYTDGFNTTAGGAADTYIQPAFGYGSGTVRGGPGLQGGGVGVGGQDSSTLGWTLTCQVFGSLVPLVHVELGVWGCCDHHLGRACLLSPSNCCSPSPAEHTCMLHCPGVSLTAHLYTHPSLPLLSPACSNPGSTFFQSAFAIPGTQPGTTTPASLKVDEYKWIAALPYLPSYNPTLTAGQGLVGFAPPGMRLSQRCIMNCKTVSNTGRLSVLVIILPAVYYTWRPCIEAQRCTD